MENHWILDWISARLESENTTRIYLRGIGVFSQYCQNQGASFSSVVENWRSARRGGVDSELAFQDKWQDLIRSYTTFIKTRYVPRTGTSLAPLTQKLFLVVVKSFFNFYRIPLDVDLPRRACVLYHNLDFIKEQLRMILSRAHSQRDRTIFLMLIESGLRANTVVNLKYEQIQEDFEKGTVPMRIITPASTIKDHVGDRWSFVGEDGAKALRDYLKPRLPLKAEAYVFASEKPSRVKGEQFTQASISTIFRRITLELKMEKGSPFGKPGHYRLHGLRKYFYNNLMPTSEEFRNFCMGHTIAGSGESYIGRDPEKHRAIYLQGYPQLRIYEAPKPDTREIDQKLAEKEKQIQDLRARVEELREVIMKHVIKTLEKEP
jgi:integrase